MIDNILQFCIKFVHCNYVIKVLPDESTHILCTTCKMLLKFAQKSIEFLLHLDYIYSNGAY